MAYDAFLKLDNIPGESTDSAHANEIEIYSFSWGASNPATIGSQSGGAGAGKASFAEFSIMKKMDKASPTLLKNLQTGTHIPKGTLVLRKAGGTAVDYMKIDFTELYVSSWQISGSSGGDDTPTESVSLAFKSYHLSYTPQSTTGGKAAAVESSWDLTINKPI